MKRQGNGNLCVMIMGREAGLNNWKVCGNNSGHNETVGHDVSEFRK